MSRAQSFSALLVAASVAACAHSAYALRPVSSIVADNVGKPVSRLEEALGAPRKVEEGSSKRVYVWFIAEQPAGAPTGFHGCEMEVTVDARSERVMGYSLSNIGWSNCREVERKIRVAEI